MPHQQVDPEQAKLKRQQHNQRYHANLAVTEQNREKNMLYQQKKKRTSTPDTTAKSFGSTGGYCGSTKVSRSRK